MAEVEVLFEHDQSKRIVKCSSELLARMISRALGLSEDAVGYADHSDSDSSANSLLLQRYCSKWDTFVDVNNMREVINGDRIRVIPIPKTVPAKEVRIYIGLVP